MARLVWTPESRWWLREIYAYISRDRPGAAYKVVHGIFEKAHLPLVFPDVGYQYQREKYPGVRIRGECERSSCRRQELTARGTETA